MTERIQRLVMAAAVGALALGGAVFAQAQSSSALAQEPATARDGDKVQSGDQTTPDGAAAETKARNAGHQAARVVGSASATPVADTAQSGSQSTPDPGECDERGVRG